MTSWSQFWIVLAVSFGVDMFSTLPEVLSESLRTVVLCVIYTFTRRRAYAVLPSRLLCRRSKHSVVSQHDRVVLSRYNCSHVIFCFRTIRVDPSEIAKSSETIDRSRWMCVVGMASFFGSSPRFHVSTRLSLVYCLGQTNGKTSGRSNSDRGAATARCRQPSQSQVRLPTYTTNSLCAFTRVTYRLINDHTQTVTVELFVTIITCRQFERRTICVDCSAGIDEFIVSGACSLVFHVIHPRSCIIMNMFHTLKTRH